MDNKRLESGDVIIKVRCVLRFKRTRLAKKGGTGKNYENSAEKLRFAQTSLLTKPNEHYRREAEAEANRESEKAKIRRN